MWWEIGSGKMNLAQTALLQAFMSRDDYENLRDEEKVWGKLTRPLLMAVVTVIWIAIVIAGAVMIHIVFAVTGEEYPFCQKKRLDQIPIETLRPRSQETMTSAYAYTEEEAAQYFWLVVFLPTAAVFLVATVYLIAGIAVAYSAPERHGCLKVVENNCCASRRGGVRCLATLNICFTVAFALMALFLGSSILILQTDCSYVLFWCYEVVCWGLVILLGGTAIFLKRKAAVIMDEGEFYGHHISGVELLEATPVPQSMLERRVNQGYRKSWMGSGLSSSDEEEGHHVIGLDDVWDDDPSQIYDPPFDYERGRSG